MSWEDFAKFAKDHFQTYRSEGGTGLALLYEPTSSISMRAMLRRFQADFRGSLYCYSPVSRENSIKGAELAFGRPLRTRFHLPLQK